MLKTGTNQIVSMDVGWSFSFTLDQLAITIGVMQIGDWWSYQQRIDYKVALLTFKVRSTSTPSYLHRLLQDREDVHNLRRRSDTPALCSLLTVHQDNNRKARFPLHSTSHLELAPKTVLDSETVTSFKSRLKTHLFSQALSHTPTDH